MSEPTQIGHYLIKGLLRHGRSADSYYAENAAMRSQKVLLRVLHADTAADPAFVRTFMEEARIAARLDHNCIASVLDLKSDDDRVYAVLEFIEGLELNELLERFGPPPPEVAAAIMREVCSALEHAHGKSILHRRLRPHLVKVTPEGGVKVLGFGLRERESMLVSTFAPDALREELYRPPEQVREEPMDVRGDLYSLAVVVYELLTRRLPFDTLIGPAGKAPPRKAPPVFEHNPLVPGAFGRLLERCLAERREERPANAAEVRRALDDLLDEYHVMHASDLLQLYLGNPPDYTEQARKRSLEFMLRDAERLSKGSDAERRAAIEELERVLAAEPNHKQAASLVRRLRPSSDPGRVPPAASAVPPAAAAPPAAPVPPAATVPAPEPPPPGFDPDRTVLDVPSQEVPRAAAPKPAPAAPPPAAKAPAPPPAAGAAPPPETRPAARPAPPPRPEPAERAPAPAAKAPPRGLLVAAVAAVAVVAAALTLFVWRPWAPRPLHGLGDDFGSPDSTVRLDVETVPPGAQVLLPSTGQTSLSPTYFENLKAGPTRVRVSLSGYQTRDTVLELAPGAPAALRLDLASLTASACTLFVVTKPAADEVLVDGLTASRLDSLTWYMPVGPGTHSVDVTAAGHEKWSRVAAAKVNAGANARVRVTLRPGAAEPVATESPGAAPETIAPPAPSGGDKPWQVAGGTQVTVECDPAAQLFVNGVAYPTMVQRAELSMGPGNHTFKFVHPDYVDAEVTKRLKRNQKSEHVRFDFRAGSGILSVSSSNGGYQVFVDGKFRGYTPLVIREVKPGTRLVELRDKQGGGVLSSRQVKVANSSKPVEVRF